MRSSPLPSARLRGSSAGPIAVERRVLRELCRATLTRAAWARISRALRGYAWRDVEHGLVYAAIERLGPRDPQTLREQLPAQATRMGFPDIDWQIYFDSTQAQTPATSPDYTEIAALIAKLPMPGAAKTNP
jgi:hypothetical protein